MKTYLLSLGITLSITAIALGIRSKPNGKEEKKKIWTDTQIDLYERQFAAREAMGEKHLLHPSKSPKKNQPNLRLIKD